MLNNVEQTTITKTKINLSQALLLGTICIVGAVMFFNFALIGVKSFESLVNKENSQEVLPATARVSNETRPAFSVPTEDIMGVLSVNKYFSEDQKIVLDINKNIIAFSVSGSVELNNRNSYARIILKDSQGNRHLVFNTDELLKDNNLNFSDICEETCHLDPLNPASLEIQIKEAKLTINQVKYLTADKTLTKTKEQIKDEQHTAKINRLNQRIKEQEFNWIAGDTGVSKLSFTEKEKLFKGNLPNTCGFLYYKAGYFPFCESADSFKGEKSNLDFDPENPFIFDWRDRHGQDWMTPVTNQLSCASCWAFGTVGAVESVINLNYNQHLDIDLSEQDLVSCSSGSTSCSTGGDPESALATISLTGVVDEDCFPYTGQNDPCANRCTDWQDRLWRTTYPVMELNKEFEIKAALLENGPQGITYDPWWHVMTLVGFGEVVSDTYYSGEVVGLSFEILENDPLIGTIYYIFKNSWGNYWGENGYGKFVIPSEDFANDTDAYLVNTPLYPPVNEPPYSIVCTDVDSDGYCWWGITPDKPADCPVSCLGEEEPDCDDANDIIGTCPEDYVCGSYPMLFSGEVVPFGDYTTFGQVSCCGDNAGEYPIQGTCCNNHRDFLEETVESYEFLLAFGSSGSGYGQFDWPNHVAVENDRIYVTDSDLNNVQIFDLDGNYLDQFGTWGYGNGQLRSPEGIEIYEDIIYVADFVNCRIQTFDLDGNFINTFGSCGTGNGQFVSAYGIDVFDNIIYVTDRSSDRIQTFDLDGNFINTFGSSGPGNGQFDTPYDISVSGGKIYVTDRGNDRIQTFDLEGNFITTFGSYGYGTGQFFQPNGIAVNNDRIFITDNNYLSKRVQVFDTDWNHVSTLSSYGSEPGQFLGVTGVDYAENKLYVMDTTNHRVQVFTLQYLPQCFLTPIPSVAPNAGTEIGF
ncbi:6-bladed beta-propeller [Patescibacteria group bacterium]|nr:6-bladed beta-propeller [Patescibacteria group bacterium]